MTIIPQELQQHWTAISPLLSYATSTNTTVRWSASTACWTRWGPTSSTRSIPY